MQMKLILKNRYAESLEIFEYDFGRALFIALHEGWVPEDANCPAYSNEIADFYVTKGVMSTVDALAVAKALNRAHDEIGIHAIPVRNVMDIERFCRRGEFSVTPTWRSRPRDLQNSDRNATTTFDFEIDHAVGER